ncbi:CDP-alcohol phosphatidyltransferase family protein [Microlunatus elymi]|uniref:CDP-alcohol phosphatidyltransferase family protein n=1 Tax=Microlunatus elymi TaxID=2596828 RepID=UPI00143DC0C7|nr:CDP-alcohol phosphatidyltransferase family protein [Microlunatus elymi]
MSTVDDLGRLAELAADGSGPLVLADAELRISLPAVLDLLDVPGDPTAALVADPRNIEAPRQPEVDLDRATVLRVGVDGRTIESAGSVRHRVGEPNRVSVGLLRVRAADRDRAAELWRTAVDELAGHPELITGNNLFDLALLILVRGGLPLGGQPLGYYDWSRPGRDHSHVGQRGLGSSPWRQRLRSASRLGDGAYSAAVVRPLSRLGTRLALRIGLTPNVITAISLGVGIVAGLLILTGTGWAWVAAAVLLQLALVIDCMDGEVARFTRRFSAFGGWLDGIGDRIKEYLVFAAVAAVGVRDGHSSAWLLAIIAMVIVTARHLEDYAYTDRTTVLRAAGAADRARALLRSILDPVDAGLAADPSARTSLPAPASRNQRISFWVKKIAHVPIAERYLILSLTLLTRQPLWVLIAAIAVSAFALAWTAGGRFLRALKTPDLSASQGAMATSAADRSGELDDQLDVGRLARFAGVVRIPYLICVAVMIGCWLAMILGICLGWWLLTLIAAVVLIFAVGGTLRAPLVHGLGWLALPLVWIAEAAVISALLADEVAGLLIFVTLAAIAYRRYELIYSIRLRGRMGPAPLLGLDGRLLLVAVLFAIAQLNGNVVEILSWGLVLLTTETLVEAVTGTLRRWRARPGAVTDTAQANRSPEANRSNEE